MLYCDPIAVICKLSRMGAEGGEGIHTLKDLDFLNRWLITYAIADVLIKSASVTASTFQYQTPLSKGAGTEKE